jgi:hypothetical protein
VDTDRDYRHFEPHFGGREPIECDASIGTEHLPFLGELNRTGIEKDRLIGLTEGNMWAESVKLYRVRGERK